MKKIPPSQRIRKQIEALFAGEGWEDEEDLISSMLYLGAQQLRERPLLEQLAQELWIASLKANPVNLEIDVRVAGLARFGLGIIHKP